MRKRKYDETKNDIDLNDTKLKTRWTMIDDNISKNKYINKKEQK